MIRRAATTVVLSLALALGGLPAVGVAAAVPPGPPLACGDVVSTDVRLTEDLECPGGIGLFVDADGVTVDLGGHTISGAGTGSAGIVVLEVDDVTIRRGTIRDFASDGAVMFPTADSRVERVRFIGIGRFALSVGTGMTIAHSRFIGNAVGVDFFEEGTRSVVRHSRFVDNGTAVNIAFGNANVIHHNSFTGNRVGVRVWDEPIGGTSDNVVRHNRLVGNDLGIWVQGLFATTGTEVSRNLVRRNRSSGILVTAELPGAVAGTVLHANDLHRNGAAPRTLTIPLPDLGGPPVEVVADDGITVAGEPSAAPDVTVRRNRALHNADLGIDAAGVTDGGGNLGRRNGDPAQCVGVAC